MAAGAVWKRWWLIYMSAMAIAVSVSIPQYQENDLLMELKTGLSGKSEGGSQQTALKCCGLTTDSWGVETKNHCDWLGVLCETDKNGSNNTFVVEITVRWTSFSITGEFCKRCVSHNRLNATALASLQHLRSLSLRDMGIDAPFPVPELSRLRKLKYLDLAGNAFRGCIYSDFSRLTFLQHLDMYGNDLTCGFPPWIAQLGVLKYLDLSRNQINGSLPDSIGGLTSLEQLLLSGNNIEGMLPVSLGHLHLLQNLSLSNNQISGIIPPALGDLISLQRLHLNDNKLNGTIPYSLGKLHLLQELDLSNNQIHGTIPSSLGDSLISSLKTVSLSGNQLQGSIPPSLGMLASLESLNVSNNKLEGNIPSALGNISSLQSLDLSSNQLNGTFSLANFANLSKLSVLILSSNKGLFVNYEKPSWTPSFQLAKLSLSGCNLTSNRGFPRFLSSQENVMTLDLSSTGLGGNIPPWLFNITINKGLRLFYLQNNSFTGPLTIPIVVQDLRYLDVSKNLITHIPMNIGYLLPSLWYLNLSANALSGYIPSSIGNLKNLGILDLSDNKLHGGMPSSVVMGMGNLATLRLSNNNLSGSMFPNGSNLLGLESLHIDGNKFEGSMSTELLKSTILKVLVVAHNNLDGFIPDWFSRFSMLRILILKDNRFQGDIPRSLCQLRSLAILDLSNNSLQGSIPPCFDNVTAWIDERPNPQIYGAKVIFNYIEEVGFAFKERKYSYMGQILSIMNGIDLSKNQLSGYIPEQLGNLKGLVTLNLSINHLTGTIPKSFKDLQQLQSMDLSDNQLFGEIPSELASIHFLSVFSVARNNLSGKIPLGGQLFSFDKSSFAGNPYLCGYPLTVNCNNIGVEEAPGSSSNEKKISWKDHTLVLYGFFALGYAFGLWCLGWTFLIDTSRRERYFEAIDRFIFRFIKLFK